MLTINNKIDFFYYNIRQMFHAQNALIELDLNTDVVDDYAELICDTKQAFITKYKDQMTAEQIKYIYTI